jgi:ribonuclease PH
MSERSDGRRFDCLRPVCIVPDYLKPAEGSALIECGSTKIICAASVEEKVPHFIRGTESGWVTSEYGMLPRSTETRMVRDVVKGRPSGRSQEIQRLIGRALRSVVDLRALGERTVWVDCDVIQADGGTRVASITGAFVALALALERLCHDGVIRKTALMDYVAAVSVGIVNGEVLLDLNYVEDSAAEVDMNVVITGDGGIVEVQGTAEDSSFSRAQLDELLDLAQAGIQQLVDRQREVLIRALGETSSFLQGQDVALSPSHSE